MELQIEHSTYFDFFEMHDSQRRDVLTWYQHLEPRQIQSESYMAVK